MTHRPLSIVVARVVVAVGTVAAVAFFPGSAGAHHEVDFDSYDCSSPTAPDEEPGIAPSPTGAPEGGQPPGPAEPTPAPQNCMPMSGERIWGTRLVRFTASSDGPRPIKRVALYILSEEEAIPSANDGAPLLEDTFARSDDVRAYDSPFSWNSTEVTPYNANYKIRVEVDTYPAFTGNDTHRATMERKNLRVDNPPSAVDAPEILAKTLGSVTLQWTAATEPDVLSYTVYRAVTKTASKKPPYSAFKQVGVTTGAAFRDSRVSPGFHWYSVKVTRRSVITPDDGISSALSPISAAAEVKSPERIVRTDDDDPVVREIPDFRRLPRPPGTFRSRGVVDAPFSYNLDFADAPDSDSAFEGATDDAPDTTDPRGPVLPVAVGMFLVSSALAVGRMPY